jgi:putative methyltransferase
MRRPNWRDLGENNWGLKKQKWKDWNVSILSELSSIVDPIRNKLQKKNIEKTLQNYPKCCISLGAGKEVPEGWIGFDRYKSGKNIFSVNMLFDFPVKTDVVDAILAEHILEHFFWDDLEYILQECFRVMKNGGKIRIVSPDAKNIARLIQLGIEAEKDYDVQIDSDIHHWNKDGMRWVRTINQLTHQWGEHKCVLTSEMLKCLMEKIGFQEITILSVKKSKFFDEIPDIHQKRFPDDREGTSFAIEALAIKE